tara:strand:+ start:1028 stop:2047 length:1020 start_codon:yes stop_codon:yes gene_type:complete
MNKNSSKNNEDEIELLDLLKTIWDGKLKIFLITLITVGIISVYSSSNKAPESFKSSLVFKPEKKSEFTKFETINKFLPRQKFDEVTILRKFVIELMDYEELIYVLENNKYIKTEIAQKSELQRQQKLFNYAKKFKISKIKEEDEKKLEFEPVEYVLDFTWHNVEEGKDIIQQTLKLALNNLEQSIFKELNDYLKIKKDESVNKDFKTIEYLTEQSVIAKELNIAENQVDNFSLPTSNVFFNINSGSPAYYLRGYKAIDMEITLIKDRTYNDFINAEEEINILKNSGTKWVDYNIFLISVRSLQVSKSTFRISILLGFLLGVFYVFILNIFQSRNVKSKR